MTKDIDEASNFAPSATAFVLDPDRPVLARSETLGLGWAVRPHRHPRGQLLWAMQGVLRVVSDEGIWIVPPTHAVWIPGDMLHHTVTETEVEIRNLYVDPDALAKRPPLGEIGCSVRVMTPLMRELILRLCETDLSGLPDDRTRRLSEVALDEIERLAEAPLYLPGGQDPRLLRLTRHLTACPEDPRPLDTLAGLAGASPRTLERLFRNETGMTFRQWRSRLKVLQAVELLNRGESSTQIAHRLGYGNASAFIAAFRTHFGCPPQSFLRRG